jgi:hypothetical protein
MAHKAVMAHLVGGLVQRVGQAVGQAESDECGQDEGNAPMVSFEFDTFHKAVLYPVILQTGPIPCFALIPHACF